MEEGGGGRSMDSTVLKKKSLILTFQNWQVETHDRSLVEVRWRRGEGPDQWTAQF